MTGLGPIFRAILLGFSRDRSALFFTILFPLVFLILVGGLFRADGTPRSKVIQVGPVAVLDALPADAQREVAGVLTITKADDLTGALASVRNGDVAAVIEQRGDEVLVHYSRADPTSSGTVRGIMDSLVQSANVAASGRPARYSVRGSPVQDESLKQIQYLTPGILDWAIAVGATFSGASTLVIWRERRLLRRLTMAPIKVPGLVGARVLVSIGVALAQTALFLVVAMAFFGLRLTNSWWTSVPLIVAGTLSFLSIGLLAGAKAKSIDTAIGMANVVVIPMAFLSGSFFPLSLAPAWVEQFAHALPLFHLNSGMTDALSRGSSPMAVLPELAVLLGFTAVTTLLAIRLFRWDDA